MLTALIDLDPTAYAASASAEKTVYYVRVGDAPERVFESAAERDAWLKEKELTKAEVLHRPELVTYPVSRALGAAQKKLDTILAALGTSRWEGFLTGKGNFREAVAKSRMYKGHRPILKPTHLPAVREWFISRGARVVNGAEADDACAIRSQEIGAGSVIVSIDKDLDCAPGSHLNPDTNDRYEVSETQALLHFLRQLISGDSADNVPGLPRLGLAKAKKELAPFEHDVPGAWARVQALYAQVKGKDAAVYLKEQMQLLWVRRFRGELITVSDFKTRYVDAAR